MSIRLQIIVPFLLCILAGIAIAFLIGREAANGQRTISSVVDLALKARSQSGDLSLSVNRFREDTDKILSMTRFVPAAEVRQRFAEYDARIGSLLGELGKNGLSAGIKESTDALSASYQAWRGSLSIALGLQSSKLIPTQEKLHREESAVFAAIDRLDTVVGTTAEAASKGAAEDLQRSIDGKLTMLGAGGAVAVLLGVLVAGGIARPIRQVTGLMRRLAEGACDVELPAKGMSREINAMIGALAVFRDNAVERLRLQTESEATQAERRRYSDEMDILVRDMSVVMGAAVRGEFSGRIATTFTVTDFGTLARDANQLVETVDANIRSILQVMNGLAEGDLRRRIQGDASGAFGDLKTCVNGTFDQLVALIGSIRTAAETVGRVSAELKGSADELSFRTAGQAASLEETAAALASLTATVQQSEAKARDARDRIAVARKSTEESGVVVQGAVSAMTRIETASGEIGKITDLIDEIAFQTNLLALNAGVEAARAGPAGAGFAVVAQEVRALAQRAKSAAGDIKDLIGKTRAEVETGVRLVKAAGDSLASIQTQVAEIGGSIETISAAAKEQAAEIAGVNRSVGEIDRLTQQNSSMVSDTVTAVDDMSREAGGLARTIARFRTASSGERPDRNSHAVRRAA